MSFILSYKFLPIRLTGLLDSTCMEFTTIFENYGKVPIQVHCIKTNNKVSTLIKAFLSDIFPEQLD